MIGRVLRDDSRGARGLSRGVPGWGSFTEKGIGAAEGGPAPPGARDALTALGVPPPKKILDLRPAVSAEPAGDAPTSEDLAAS